MTIFSWMFGLAVMQTISNSMIINNIDKIIQFSRKFFLLLHSYLDFMSIWNSKVADAIMGLK